MVLVLFFLILFVLIISFFSTIEFKIDIKNFNLLKEEKKHKIVNKDHEIIVYAYIFKKVKVYNYKVRNLRIPRKYFDNINKKLDYKVLRDFVANNINDLNIQIIELENLNLKLKVGVENVILTSGLVTILNVFISLILPKLISNYTRERFEYEIKPIYENTNKIELFLDTSIRIKLFSLIKALSSYSKARRQSNNGNIKLKHNFIPIKNVN